MGHLRNFGLTTATSGSTPVNGHSQDRQACLKRAIRRHQVRAGRPRQKRLIVPLDQLESDSLGTLEGPQLSADVVHLVAQHGYAVGH